VILWLFSIHVTRHFKHRAVIFWLWNGVDSQSATKFEQQWNLWSVRFCSCKVHNSAGRLTTSTQCIQCSCHDCSSYQSTILRLQMPWIKNVSLRMHQCLANKQLQCKMTPNVQLILSNSGTLCSVRLCSCKVHESAGRLTTSKEHIQFNCHDCSSCQSTMLRWAMPWIKKCQLKNASIQCKMSLRMAAHEQWKMTWWLQNSDRSSMVQAFMSDIILILGFYNCETHERNWHMACSS